MSISSKRRVGAAASACPRANWSVFQPVLDISDVGMHIRRAVKLSNKGRYAVRALFDIAYFNDGEATQAKDIAERQGIPPRFLEQIFQDLKRAGIVGSKRGPQGGYRLAGDASSVRLGDVIRALEGPLVLGDTSAVSPPETVAITESIFQDLSKRIEACFDAVTLSDVCDRARSMGLMKQKKDSYTYVI